MLFAMVKCDDCVAYVNLLVNSDSLLIPFKICEQHLMRECTAHSPVFGCLSQVCFYIRICHVLCINVFAESVNC